MIDALFNFFIVVLGMGLLVLLFFLLLAPLELYGINSSLKKISELLEKIYGKRGEEG